MTEDAHGAITLCDRAKLRVEGGDASIPVVLKEPAELGPDITCGGAISHHKIEELRRDASIQPLDDGEVVFDPAGIVGSGWRIAGYVVKERAATEMNLK